MALNIFEEFCNLYNFLFDMQIYISHSSGGWKSQVKVPAFSGSVFGEGLNLVSKK